jgi:hypothetical protein
LVRSSPRPQPTNPGLPLPKNLQVLGLLLQTVDKALQFLEPLHDRMRMSLDEIKRGVEQPMELNRELLAQSHSQALAQWAKGGPSIDLLLPYIGEQRFNESMDNYNRTVTALHEHSTRASVAELRAWVAAFSRVVSAQWATIQPFQQLQRAIVAAIEIASSDSADKNADRTKKSGQRIPKNDAALALARKINEDWTEGTSKTSIALDFTNGDYKMAATLLRELRRFKHLLPKKPK